MSRAVLKAAVFVCVGLMTLGSNPVHAHVALDAPNGGEVLVVGSTVVIEWHVIVQHGTQNWDLWYSTTGDQGPWIPIVMDLPVGNPAIGSVHTYLWVVPAAVSTQVRVRVRQDNSGTDYLDHSNSNLTIAQPAFYSDVPELSVATGGVANFTLNAGATAAGHTYVVAGSVTGTSPGLTIGSLVIPLVPDWYFEYTLLYPDSGPFSGFTGVLDGSGSAGATFTLPPGVPPGLVGSSSFYAFGTLSPSGALGIASNAVELVLEQ